MDHISICGRDPDFILRCGFYRETQGFSWVVMGNSGIPSSCHRWDRPLLEKPGVNWDTSRVGAEESALSKKWDGEYGVLLNLRWETQDLSRFAMQNLEILLSCHRWDRPPLEVRGWSWDSSRLEAGESALISRWDREHGFPLQLWLVSWGTSRVAEKESSLLLSCEGKLGIALELRQENPGISHVEGWICWFFSRSNGDVKNYKLNY